MQKWIDLYKKYEVQIRNVFLAIFALLAALYGSYQAGQTNVLEAGRPTPTLSATKPGTRVTLTPIQTVTSLPTATFEATMPASATPGVTLTPEVTPTPPLSGCPVHLNEWHAAMNIVCQRHHHGIDPRSDEVKAIFNIDGFDIEKDFLDLYGELWQPLWLSSPTEATSFPDGFIWGLFKNPTCEQFDNNGQIDVSEDDCIVAVAYRFHDTGSGDHGTHRNHSEAVIIKACAKLPNGEANLNECWIIAIPGMLADYGPKHLPYKAELCHNPAEPGYETGGYPLALIDQPPYMAFQDRVNNRGENWVYWVASDCNPVICYLYPQDPNSFLFRAWMSEAWQLWDESICEKPTFDEFKAAAGSLPPIPGLKDTHHRFQLVHMEIPDYPAGPFFGYMDVYGHWWPEGECTQATALCVPGLITASAPGGSVLMRFDANGRGDCSIIPCFVVDTNGVEIIFPPLDKP